MSKLRFVVPFFLFAVLSLVMVGPTLWGAIYSGGDTVTYVYPAAHVHVENTSDGNMMNPYYLAGFPTALSPVGDYFDPLNRALFRLLDDPFTAVHLRFILAAFLGLVFAYLFARQTGLSIHASCVVACGYLLGQPLFYFTAMVANAGAFFVFPALLYLVVKMRQSRWWGYAVFGVLMLWWAWVSGFIQTVFYSSVLAGIYALYLDFTSGAKPLWSRWQSTIRISFVGAIGTALAVPFLAATNALREISLRTSGFGTGDLDGVEVMDVIHFVMPDYFMLPFLSTTLTAGFYIGALSFVCVITALPFLWRDQRTRFFLVSYGVLLIVLCVPLGIGALVQHLPAFSLFHTMKRLMLPGVFLLAYLGGYAFDAIRTKDFSLRGWPLLGVGLMVSGVCAVVLVANAFFAVVPWRESAWQDTTLRMIFSVIGKDTSLLVDQGEHYRNVFTTALEATYQQVTLMDWRTSLPLLLLVLAFALLYGFAKGKITNKTFMNLGLVIVVLNVCIVYGAQYNSFVPRAALTQPPEIVSVIAESAQSPHSRIVGFLVGFSQFREVTSKRALSAEESVVALRNTLGPNAHFFFDIPRLDGYEPFWPERAHHFFREVLGNEVFSVAPGQSFEEQLSQKKESFVQYIPLLSSFSVEHIVSGYPLEHEWLTLLGTVGVLPDFRVYVYQNTHVYPGVTNPRDVVVVSEWNDALFEELLRKDRYVVECAMCADVTAGRVHIQDVTHEPSRVAFQVRSDGGWVHIATAPLPGWSATIDGRVVPTYVSNYLMTALYVPPGSEQVVLSYEPTAW